MRPQSKCQMLGKIVYPRLGLSCFKIMYSKEVVNYHFKNKVSLMLMDLCVQENLWMLHILTWKNKKVNLKFVLFLYNDKDFCALKQQFILITKLFC